MTTTKETDNTFEVTLREMRAGLALDELSEKLAELVGAVRETGKGGKLKLEITVKPASRGGTIAVMLEDDITVKVPKADKETTIFYSTDQNLLQRTDPRQKEFELREVSTAPPVELKEVSA